MNENTELHTYTADDSLENDIQEYHEIKQDTTLDDIETSFSSKPSPKRLNDYDFFTQHDVKTEKKKHLKKKKSKKKDKSSNLMDIISSEIAASVAPVTENVVTMVDVSKERQSSYLRSLSNTTFRKSRTFISDAESGWNSKSDLANLSPIFPRILENAVTEACLVEAEYVEPCTFNDIVAKNNDTNNETSIKFLDISIRNITAKHHHSFTLEKLLCSKLLDTYNEYSKVQKLLKVLSKDIKVNRETKDNLKADLMKVSPSKKEDVRFDKTVRKYTDKLIHLKAIFKENIKLKKQFMHKVISLWSDIEMVREKRECIETPYLLDFTKIEYNENEFEKQWNDTFNTEYLDILDLIEYEYVTNYLEYKEAKSEHKRNPDNKPIKPKLIIDKEKIKSEAEMFVDEVVNKEEIDIELKKDESILTDFKQIGQRFVKHNYNFLVYVDDVFVCESENYLSAICLA
ncbi:unnamed protein product [Spodoptera littoralis]|uniref:Uncharacterized protein n=1 Tax=Spodoptera littoralis TaxID=7109 RepID=A0A9P0I1L9_SPOLI|nr:unnamed protein product [Spodoptera littoralis]